MLFTLADNKSATVVAAMRNSRGSMTLNGDAASSKRRSTLASNSCGSKDDVNSVELSASRTTLSKAERKELARPMARKDALYSGSVTNLPECQSQTLSSYRQSMISLPKGNAGGASTNSAHPDQGTILWSNIYTTTGQRPLLFSLSIRCLIMMPSS